MPYFRGSNQASLDPIITLLREIGARYDKTPAQIALRWLLENPLVLPIPGAKNSRQAMDNAGALTFQLTADEIDMLHQATMPAV